MKPHHGLPFMDKPIGFRVYGWFYPSLDAFSGALLWWDGTGSRLIAALAWLSCPKSAVSLELFM
jgi:hypothetical protein